MEMEMEEISQNGMMNDACKHGSRKNVTDIDDLHEEATH